MKTAGLSSVFDIKRRALRLYAMDRLAKPDVDRIVGHCDALIVIIQCMTELDGVPLDAKATASN